MVTAGVLEYEPPRRLGTLPLLGGGLIEEFAKLIVPAAMLLGVASGAGPAVLETMGYAFVVLIQSRGNLAVADGVLFSRGILGPAAHMAWTALAAAALWAAAAEHWHGRAVVRFLGTYALMVALHTVWDLSGSTAAYVVLAAISLALLAVTSHRLAAPHRREAVLRRPCPSDLQIHRSDPSLLARGMGRSRPQTAEGREWRGAGQWRRRSPSGCW